MAVNKNFPNYDKTKPRVTVVKNISSKRMPGYVHSPGYDPVSTTNRKGRRGDAAWQRGEPQRALNRKREKLLDDDKNARIKREKAKMKNNV